MNRNYKLNKSELTRLKRQEKLYGQYVPVLKLKQEQLQIELSRIRKHLALARNQHEQSLAMLSPYISLLSDPHSPFLYDVVAIEQINTSIKSVAGISINAFKDLSFAPIVLPYFQTAPWLWSVIPLVKSYVSQEIQLRLLREEDRIIAQELRKATQKVNLFDKVLIPQTKDAIRRIKIALGDEQVAMVSRGKIAKAKRDQHECIAGAPNLVSCA